MAGRPAPGWAALALLFLLLATPGPCVGAEKAGAKKKPWYWSQFKPEAAAATTIDKSDDFSVARNLWFHVQRFFAVLDSKDISKYDPNNHTIGADIPFSQNMLVCKLPFTDVPRHYRNIQAGMLRGTTLWIDFPFPAFPENMGHWAEVLAPVYSALTEGAWKERAPEADGFINALLFPNLRRSQVQGLIWVMDMLRLALRPGLSSPRALPRMLFADELESLDPTAWLALERVLLVHTRYHLPSGRSGFVKPEHAAAFRAAAYAAANISLGGPAWQAGVAPPVITYLMAMNHEPVVNSGQVLGALREVGDQLGMAVRPYSVTPGAAFPSFVASMAQTGVLVARHGPLLANAMFLPPGAVVLELLPYNWEWQGISEVYLNLTRSVGCVHHFAWKANSSEWVVYLEPEDAKYSHWTPEECSSSYCLEAHARAGMLVDTQRLKEMLLDVLPDALKGAPVAELAPRLPFQRSRLSSLVVRAEKQTDTERRPSLPGQPVEVTSSQEDPEEFESAYGLFNWKAYNERFDVPWGAKETVLGMVAWSAAFVGVGLAFIPVLRAVAGPDGFSGLTATDKSAFALVNQVVETAVSLAIIRLGVVKFEPLPVELFKYDLRQPFKKPRGWLTWGLLGMALSPAVVYVSAVLSEGLGASDAAGRGTVDAVSSIITMDFSTYASLFATTAILAPLLEETVFRGFLLTSLTKWMPVPAAVALSSVAFGMVHLTPRDFPQLTALGFLLGFSYVRSRNLLTPMLIHGAWNGSVLTILFLLASQGIDIQELIHAN